MRVCNQPYYGVVRSYTATKQEWTRPRLLSPEEILKIVCIESGITEKQVQSRNRTKDIVEARHLAIFFIRKRTTLSVVRIGRFFGIDHTSILFALKKVQVYYDTEKPYRIKFHTIEWLLDKAARL